MKKITRMLAFVLMMALVLCSFAMPVGATGTASNWTVNNGSITSETSEVYIVDTVTVQLAPAGYIQHTEKLTDLIGADGKDGKGFVNVIIDDGTPEKTKANSYVFMQFIGSSAVTEDIPRDGATDKGLTWYIAGHSTENGRIDNHNGTVALEYGPYSAFSAAGYKMAFTKKTDGKVYVRAIGTGVYNSATDYNTSEVGAVASAQTLASIKGDGNTTGEDGIYLRLREYVDTGVKLTITVAYPKPANYDYEAEHWTVTDGSTVLDNSIETWYLDTVTASYAGPDGYVQHNVKHTDLIGENGMDGKGWVNVIVDDGTKGVAGVNGYEANGYNLLQLVSDPSAAALSKVENTTNSPSIMTWYLRTTTPAGGAVIYAESTRGQGQTVSVGNIDDLLGAGQRFVFTQNADEKVQIRCNNIGAASTLNDYTDSAPLASKKKLSELVGANNTTGEDGVYVRVENERDTATFPVTVSVFYKGENPAPSASASPSPSASPSASAVPSATPGAQNKPTGDSSMMLIVMAIALCAGGAIVLSKKRGFAK